jgi:hypothetical protein
MTFAVLVFRSPQSKYHDARRAALRHRDDLREIEIEGQHDAPLCSGFREDVAIRKPMKPLLAEMDRVVAAVAKPLNDAVADAHVRQETHRLFR